MKSGSITPVKEIEKGKNKLKYRTKLNLVFDKIRYNQTNIVETIFSVVKRKLGESLGAKKIHLSSEGD